MGAPDHSSRKHAMLSASKADRWINCTPSARLEEKVEETGKPSKYAEEGTLAHEMAECYLRARFRITPVDVTSAELRKLKKSDLYTEAMDEPVMAYCQYVTDQYTEALRKTKDALVLLEERLDFSAWVEQGFGTGDACIIADGVMEIIDLKFGTGVPVFAENNAQLMLYALGALSKFEMVYDINMVKLTIVQPRQDRISSWEITPEDLYKWGEEVVKPKAALAYSGEGELQVGHWCRWCKVKALCRKMADHNLDLAKHEFKEPELLTTEELAQIFEQAPMLQEWVNAVSEHLLSKAISGEKIPGYKVVEGRSIRKWTDESAVQEVLTACDYTPDQFQVVKLAGIPAIEKLLKRTLIHWLGTSSSRLQANPLWSPSLTSVRQWELNKQNSIFLITKLHNYECNNQSSNRQSPVQLRQRMGTPCNGGFRPSKILGINPHPEDRLGNSGSGQGSHRHGSQRRHRQIGWQDSSHVEEPPP